MLNERGSDVFRIHRLAVHEVMHPLIVDRPDGTGDYLFMLFHSEVRIKSDRGDAMHPAGSLMVWTPKDGHYYGHESKAWDHSWFHCSGTAIRALLKTTKIPIRSPILVSDASLMEKYLLDTTAELSSWQYPDAIILRNLFESFIRGTVRQLFAATEQIAPAKLLDLRNYLEKHFHKTIRLPELAHRIGWSVPHLCAEFKRFFGLPLIQYVQQLRMNQAAYLLRNRNKRIGEIGLMVGYPDLYTFSKMFKRRFGISPRHFREINLHR